MAHALRWMANDCSLPRKIRFNLWAMSLDCDDTAASEACTRIDDEEPVDHESPPF